MNDIFQEITVSSSALARDYMGLIAGFGVHIPTNMIPRGNYRLSDVVSRWTNLSYRCHACGEISEFRGKDNTCPSCDAPRKTRRLRRFRKVLLWLSLRFLRRWRTYIYLGDQERFNRCPFCGSFIRYEEWDYDFDDGWGARWCPRCDYEESIGDSPGWGTEEENRAIAARLTFDSYFWLARSRIGESSEQAGRHVRNLMNAAVNHNAADEPKPVKEIPIEDPWYRRAGFIDNGLEDLWSEVWKAERLKEEGVEA